MTNQIISLEEIIKRINEMRQRKKDEVDIPHQREITGYLKLNKHPKLSLFSFGEKRRNAEEEIRKYNGGLEAIDRKYQSHPLAQEWAKLQEYFPRVYINSETSGGMTGWL